MLQLSIILYLPLRITEITRDHVQVIFNRDGQQRMEEVSRLVFRETSGVTTLCMSCSSGHGSQWRARVSDRARSWWVCPGSTSGSSFDWMKRLQRILRMWWTWTKVENIPVWNILSNVAPLLSPNNKDCFSVWTLASSHTRRFNSSKLFKMLQYQFFWSLQIRGTR